MQKPKEWEQDLGSLPLKRTIPSNTCSFGVQLFWYTSTRDVSSRVCKAKTAHNICISLHYTE